MANSKQTPRVVFLDRDTLPRDVELRPLEFDHELVVHGATDVSEVAERIRGATIVITNKVPVRASAIGMAPKLKLIAIAATGSDIVDLPACRERGITVANIRNYAVNTVPEHTFALILALSRSIVPYYRSVARGAWQACGQFCYFDYPIRDLAGSTLGVIGDGVLGQAVADLGKAFGMHVRFSSYKGTSGMGPLYTPFEEVLRISDVITLHVPLLPSTQGMIGAREFAAMERRPLLINTSRGGLVDENALWDALTSGQIAGAGFDVAAVEPPPTDHPLMRLLALPNFILTPHVAWASREAIQALADQLIENIELYWRGTPRHVIAS